MSFIKRHKQRLPRKVKKRFRSTIGDFFYFDDSAYYPLQNTSIQEDDNFTKDPNHPYYVLYNIIEKAIEEDIKKYFNGK